VSTHRMTGVGQSSGCKAMGSRLGSAGTAKTPFSKILRLQGVLKFLHIFLDFAGNGVTMKLSPPIQFRIEWADSQGMSPLLGCRPILIYPEFTFASRKRANCRVELPDGAGEEA
jgi:hypothetical protein